MISYSVYKVVHLVGVMMVFLSIGGIVASPWRKPIAAIHGLGLVLSLVGGFGLLARLGVVHGSLPGWVLAKLGIWTILAAAIGVLIRKPALFKVYWPLSIFLGGTAAYLAGSKPF